MVHDVAADRLIASGSTPSQVCLSNCENARGLLQFFMMTDLNLPGIGIGIPASGLVTSIWQAIM